MNRTILFHLDPLDEFDVMCAHRAAVYIEIATKIKKSNVTLVFYGRERYAKFAEQSGMFDRVLVSKTPSFQWPSYGTYHTLAFGNNLPSHVETCLLKEYSELCIAPAVIVTNTPSASVGRAWPFSRIYHYELGYFNRKPFPVLHQLDPWGYSYKSLLSNYPNLSHAVNKGDQNNLDTLRDWALSNSGLRSDEIGKDDAVFFPLQSGTTWMVRLESALSRLQQVEYVSKKFPDRLIKIVEKKDYPLLPSELEKIDKIPNVQILENGDPLCEGSFMVAKCRDVFTMSPSLALQTIFWGNELSCLPGTSMAAWMLDSQRALNALASYHSKCILQNEINIFERFEEFYNL